MPRQLTHHTRVTHQFSGDFSQQFKRFQRESKLSWAEIRRRLGVDRETIRRWRDKGVLPSTRNYLALLALADSFGLGHLFRD